mgnify:CR=1 FL=1
MGSISKNGEMMFFLFMGLFFAVAAPPKPVVKEQKPIKWVKWKPHRERFVVEFPTKPTVKKERRTTSIGDLELVMAYAKKDQSWGYIASYTYYPNDELWKQDPDSFLQEAAKGITSRLGAAFPVNNVFPVPATGYSGISLLFQTTDQKARKRQYQMQLFLIDNALIQLMVYSEVKEEVVMDAARFFTSFYVKKE